MNAQTGVVARWSVLRLRSCQAGTRSGVNSLRHIRLTVVPEYPIGYSKGGLNGSVKNKTTGWAKGEVGSVVRVNVDIYTPDAKTHENAKLSLK